MDFSTETRRIINAHQNDFWEGNYSQVVKSFDKYVDSLGGVFLRREKGQPVSVEAFRERVEYVMGLMAIWKFCYWNGKTWWYFKDSESKSFYHRKEKKCNTRSVEQLCKGEGARTTNCNYGIDSLLINFGMLKTGTANFDRWREIATEVTDKKKLREGDLVHFFTSNGWSKGDWKHIAIVYKVERDKIWLADFGNRFIRTGIPFHYMTMDGEKAGGEYNYYWRALHIMDLDSATDMAIEFYAKQVRLWDEFKKLPNFTEAYAIYEEYLEYQSSWLDDAADYVLDGKAGSGETRKAFFGSEYDNVQKRVNEIIQMAQDVIIGKYGSGEVRRKALNGDYDIVQREVNRILVH